MVLTNSPSPAATSASESEAVHARIRGSLRESSAGPSCTAQFEAMGTRCSLTVVASPTHARELLRQMIAWIAGFESKFSRFLPNSLISRINDAAGKCPVAIDPETEQLLALCDQMHFVTGGVFDPTALPLLRLWNWKAGKVPDLHAIAAARELVGWRKVRRSPGQIFLPATGMGLDLGGMGKEFAVDCVAQALAAASVAGALVDFGGDVRVVGLPGDGRPGWHVGLQDPKAPARCWCGLGLREGAVATSGDYLRRFEVNGTRYGHILDVRSGWPVANNCQAVSVVAPSCTLAGMLSTAAFVLGEEKGLRLVESQMGAACAILTEEQTVTSRRFADYVVSKPSPST